MKAVLRRDLLSPYLGLQKHNTRLFLASTSMRHHARTFKLIAKLVMIEDASPIPTRYQQTSEHDCERLRKENRYLRAWL